MPDGRNFPAGLVVSFQTVPLDLNSLVSDSMGGAARARLTPITQTGRNNHRVPARAGPPGGRSRNSFLRDWDSAERSNTNWFLPPGDVRGKINRGDGTGWRRSG